MGSSTKESKRLKMVQYISDPDNIFPTRSDLAVTVLGYKHTVTLYKLFSPDELTEIETEGLELRKKRTARQRAAVYDALYREAVNGNVPAIKEYLDRIEGKIKDKVEVDQGDVEIKVTLVGIDD